MAYVYEKTEHLNWTVGHYDPTGKWHPDSDHGNTKEASNRVHYLNGGNPDYDQLKTDAEGGKYWFEQYTILKAENERLAPIAEKAKQWFDAYKEGNQRFIEIAQLSAKMKSRLEQVEAENEALKVAKQQFFDLAEAMDLFISKYVKPELSDVNAHQSLKWLTEWKNKLLINQ